MSTLILNHEKLNYQVHHGATRPAGPPLVLVHGAGGDLMHWPTQIRRLPGQTVYALDLPGHGHSGGQGRSDIGSYAEVVRGFADAVQPGGLPPFVLAGHSMGGAIALECALRDAGRLAGLVLVGTGARLRVAPQVLDGVLTDLPATAELLATWVHGARVDPNIQRLYARRLREVNPQVIHDDFVACNAFDRTVDLPRITLPTLILCGDADRMTPVKYSHFLHERIAGAQLILAPGAGHMVMLEQPAVISAAIVQFLASLAPSHR